MLHKPLTSSPGAARSALDGRGTTKEDGFDHDSDPNFLAYYEQASLSDKTLARFTTVRDKALSMLRANGLDRNVLRVADIGCGAGTQAILWAELRHEVSGLDVNAPLLAIARTRALERRLQIRFDVGTATELPYRDSEFDVCLLPELLEHVRDWESCVREAVRILKPGGLLYLSTTNLLCPVQQEFDLPAYSWYPSFVKRRYERLAVTSRPELVSHAKYPAVHWFTFYGLRRYLAQLGMAAFDRFDLIDLEGRGALQRLAIRLCRTIPVVRFAGHVLTEGTTIFALKDAAPHSFSN